VKTSLGDLDFGSSSWDRSQDSKSVYKSSYILSTKNVLVLRANGWTYNFTCESTYY